MAKPLYTVTVTGRGVVYRGRCRSAANLRVAWFTARGFAVQIVCSEDR